MPEHFARLNAVQIFQLVAIVLILPIQYFISQKSSEAHRQYQLDRFLTHIQSSLSNVFNNSFVRWCYEKLAINDADGKTQEDIIPKTSMKSKEKSKEENFGHRIPSPPVPPFSR
uniref:Uncharacterized protein n=1 Tax=Romanomermis culicivorax TaxID=13658 RepID=A0A915J318_ROMCU